MFTSESYSGKVAYVLGTYRGEEMVGAFYGAMLCRSCCLLPCLV